MSKKLESFIDFSNLSYEIPEYIKSFRERSPLEKYIISRFGSKQNFLSFILRETSFSFKAKSYEKLLAEIFEKLGKDKLLEILGINDEFEAEKRAYLFDLLYNGLYETTWLQQLNPIYEAITGEKVKTVKKIEKRKMAHKIAFSVDEKSFTDVWIKLSRKDIIPVIYHYGNLTIGPLGWIITLYPCLDRWHGYSKIFNIISKYFDEDSIKKIFDKYIDHLKHIAQSDKNGLPEKLKLQLIEKLKIIDHKEKNANKNATYLIFRMQLIEAYLSDDELCEIINNLLAEKVIDPPRIKGFYERFPYSSSEWIITQYEIFKQPQVTGTEPTKRLAKLLLQNFDHKCLEPELKSYHGSYDLRVQEYCILENPEEILKKIGVFNLRKIAEELNIVAAYKIRDEEDITRLILLRLGFKLPPNLYGLNAFKDLLHKRKSKLRLGKKLSEIMSDVYGGLESILKDLNYFYMCYVWQLQTKYIRTEDIERELRKNLKKLGLKNTYFTKLTLGQQILLLEKMNNLIKNDNDRSKRFLDMFKRDTIVPSRALSVLKEIQSYRAPLFAHKSLDKISKPIDLEQCNKIIDKMFEFSKIIEEKRIYPILFRIDQQVTNKYGTQYFRAVDEAGREWIVESQWLDPSRPYFMYSETNPVAINPLIIEKIF